MGKRYFNPAWLGYTDSNNQLVHVWCVPNDDFTVTCKVCSADITVKHMGFTASRQHSEKQKQRGLSGVDLFSEGKPKQQAHLSKYFMKKSELTGHESKKEEIALTSTASVELTLGQKVTRAEIIATIQYAANNVPFSQADNLGACYKEQFPDSRITDNISISSNKMSYIVGYGLGPYFTQETVKELVNGNSYFTLQFDETVSAQVKKQMDLLVRYWSETSNEVKVKYLTSLMFGSATATIVVKEMMYAFKKLGVPIHLMVSLGMDGPNVNKSIRDKLNNIKQEKGLPKLVMCPPNCLIHVCHNSFKKGLEQFGFNAEDLCLNLYYFFKKSPCRKSELYDIEESLGLDDLVVLCHVQSRWLSLVPALQLFLAVKEALQKLLLVEMPKNDKNMRNAKYMAIKKSLESNDVAIEVEFLISIKPIFDNFMTKFQAEEPMIHLLYSNCEKLLKVAMGRLMKSEVYMDRNGKD